MRTIKSLVRRLIAKNLVTYTVDPNDSRVYHYEAAISREEALESKSDALLSLAYESNAFDLLSHYVKQADLNDDEIAALQKYLEEKKREKS